MFILYQNITISYEIYGFGKTIVFLHGFLENKEMWNPLLPHFKEYQIITLDLLGHGTSGTLSNCHSMESQAEMVAFVLEKLQIQHTIFVGHSMGGYVALALLEKKPSLFTALVLQNSTTRADSEERKIIRTRFNQLLDKNFDTSVSISIANLFSNNFRKNHEDILKETQKIALKTSLDGVKAAQEGMKLRKDTTEIWKNSAFEKCLILGIKDEILDYKNTLKIAKENEVILLPNGHMSHLEDQNELIKIYKKFFLKVYNK
jgi:pimeloyl-ACP methyl ester carboxylesterase